MAVRISQVDTKTFTNQLNSKPMKTILFAICMMLFASCKQVSTFQVCHTGEKVELVNDVYEVGDTVILVERSYTYTGPEFEIDKCWIKFNESYKYLETTGYYKAVVIE